MNTVRVGLNKAWIADEVIFKKCQMFLKQPKRFGFMSLRQCGKNRFTVLQGFPVLQSLSVIASLACSGMFITPSFGGNMYRRKCTTTYYEEANEKVWLLEQEHCREGPAYIS